MTTIYVVTQGEYSDYSILGMYSTKEKADYAVKLYGDDSGIEEYELDALPPHPPGELRWTVRINNRGGLMYVSQIGPDENYTAIEIFRERFWGGEVVPHHVFLLWARDKDHAIKIATEKRREMLAMGTWTEEKVG